jgi:hypothetical protein
MKSPDECEVCRRLSDDYEAATMEWFRVQGQLRVAEYARDENVTARIIAELSAISARRQALREAREKHEFEQHPRTHIAGC